MDLSKPLIDLIPSLHGSVLTVLMDYTAHGNALSGRQVAARIKDRGSQEGVRRVLQTLVEAGLVHRRDHPSVALYSINWEHLALTPLMALRGVREQLFERIRARIATWEIQPVSAVVFGSVARGDSHPKSDVDVL